MALNLMSLLQALGGQDQQNPEDVVDDGGITVQANRKKPAKGNTTNFPDAPSAPTLTNGPDAPDFGNRSYIEAARAAMENAPQHKGMFGTKGTLRDVLGTIGDAFLVQSGNRAIYSPQRDLEKQQDAMSGVTENPLAAVERMAQAGNPELSAKLLDNVQSNDLRKAQVQGMNDARDSQNDKRDFDKRETGLNRVSRWVRGGLPYGQIVAGAKSYGISPEQLAELGVKEGMTADERGQFSAGDMTVNQQEQIPLREKANELREKSIGVQQQNATSNRIRANRPPAGRAAPQPTNAAMAAPLIDKVKAGKPLTAGETETLNRLGYNANRGQGRKARTVPPLPPGFSAK